MEAAAAGARGAALDDLILIQNRYEGMVGKGVEHRVLMREMHREREEPCSTMMIYRMQITKAKGVDSLDSRTGK